MTIIDYYCRSRVIGIPQYIDSELLLDLIISGIQTVEVLVS